LTQVVPLQAVPAQTFAVTLTGLPCQITLHHKTTGLFLDLVVNGSPVIQGALCLDRVLLVRDLYLGFIGDLAFVDIQGRDDPVYTGLGDRFLLFYLAPADFTTVEASA